MMERITPRKTTALRLRDSLSRRQGEKYNEKQCDENQCRDDYNRGLPSNSAVKQSRPLKE